jgi:hypothetical protein
MLKMKGWPRESTASCGLRTMVWVRQSPYPQNFYFVRDDYDNRKGMQKNPHSIQPVSNLRQVVQESNTLPSDYKCMNESTQHIVDRQKGRTDGRTDGQTDRQTDRQTD